MGAGHSHALYVHEHSVVHRMAPQTKLVSALVMVASVAITPRRAIWAFLVFVFLLGVVVVVARIPVRFLLTRLLAVAPFVVFALFIPFVATGESVEIVGIDVSVEGMWGAWNILVKALLGAGISIVLTATTEVPDIIRGMGVLHVPALFTSIATFMIRYLELVSDELRRMRVAMTARGYDPRWLSQARPIATSAGALFVRSYERGERVHAAMLARGFTGEMPRLEEETPEAAEWALVAVVAVSFAAVAVIALVTT